MHTTGKNADSTWWVGRPEYQHDGAVGFYSVVVVMFDKMSPLDAMRLCNFLNGGAALSGEVLASWTEYAA